VVDVYRDAKHQGIYPQLFTNPEGNNCFSIYITSDSLSDDRVSVKLRVTESCVLSTSPFFGYVTLCDCIEHYTVRIDSNQD